MNLLPVILAFTLAAPADGPSTAAPEVEAAPPVASPADGPRRPRDAHAKISPGAAAALSTLFPGAGHIYLGDHDTARGLMVLGALELGGVMIAATDGWPTRAMGADFNPLADPDLLFTLTLFQNTWTYSIFAAYRDARRLRDNRGYRLPIPKGDLDDLLFAPFNPEVMLQPEVGLGLIGMLALGLLVSHLVDASLTPTTRSLFERETVNFMGRELDPARGAMMGELYYLGLFGPVAIGEEAMFRGFMQSTFSESLGRWGGWGTASLVFGAAHVPNVMLIDDPGEQERYLGFAIPLITLLGAYMGWVYMFNDYSLAEPVALHFWYDFLLSGVSFVLNPDSQPFAVNITLPL